MCFILLEGNIIEIEINDNNLSLPTDITIQLNKDLLDQIPNNDNFITMLVIQDLCNGLYVRSIYNNGFSFSESPLSFQFINRFLEGVDHKSRIALLFVVYTIYVGMLQDKLTVINQTRCSGGGPPLS